jgi:small subunit ribosomal protein S9
VIEEPETPETPEEEQPAAEEPTAPEAEAPAEEQPAAAEAEAEAEAEAAPAPEAEAQAPAAEEVEEEPAPRVKPEIPGADLEVDIVPEGTDALALPGEGEEGDADAEAGTAQEPEEEQPLPIADAAIDLGKDARYRGTGRRKTAVARVILRPGSGAYAINGRDLATFFPRPTLQRNIRQPLETVGYEARMDVVATIHGGGVSSQAGALRHGISRALLEADPNLRAELKRRGFLTRDARVKERKKAGLKKARKRPQFSKR